MWQDDNSLFEVAKRQLFTAVVGDILDQMGYRHQFLSPHIRPLDPQWVLVGRAMPVLGADYFGLSAETGSNPLSRQHFGLMLQALDDLKPNEVYVATGASLRYALWGGLMSTRALKLHAAGAVLDGYSRDTHEILHLKFPTWSYGPYAQDQAPRGKVVDFRLAVEIDNVTIEPGDILFGDREGVVVVPKAAEREVFERALEKVRNESAVRKAIEQGVSASEAYAKFGVM
jgi:regulator of RNase E activity RraA